VGLLGVTVGGDSRSRRGAVMRMTSLTIARTHCLSLKRIRYMSIELDGLREIRKFAGFFEVYHRTSFQCYRNAKSGAVQEVTVEIFDAGPDHSPNRYHVVATAADGKAASGNPGDSVNVALAFVHWWEFDK